MPLFFFISGYLLSNDYLNNLKLYVHNKIKTLILPYIYFAFLFILLGIIYTYFNMGFNRIMQINYYPFFSDVLYGNGIVHWIFDYDRIWFLPCLFIVGLLFILQERSLRGKMLFSIIIGSVIMYLIKLYFQTRLPFGIDIAFYALIFFYVGYIFKKYNVEKILYKQKRILLLITTIPLIIITFFISSLNTQVQFGGCIIGNYYYFYTAAFAGIFTCVLIAIILPANPLFNYIGQNALLIYAFEGGVHRAIQLYIPLETILNRSIGTILGLSYTIVQLAILLPFSYIVFKLFPFLNGRGSMKESVIIKSLYHLKQSLSKKRQPIVFTRSPAPSEDYEEVQFYDI